MPQLLRKELLIIASALLLGCATASSDLYYWGPYEDLIYLMYKKPGSADPMTQIATLREHIGKAGEAGKRVPPGLHAHLGYMHYLQNDFQAAMAEFETEKKLFPESSIFIDGLTGRLKR